MATDYSKQTVVQLKKLATDRGISAALKSGLRKADIIEKIQEFDAEMPTQKAPGTDEKVVDDATVEQVSGIEDEPDNEAVAPPHHEPIQPVEQEILPETITTDASIPEPSVEQPPAPDPIVELPATIQEPSTTEVAELVVDATQPSSHLNTPVPTDEIIEDSRKRKRRSLTPPVHAAEIAAKRQKQEENLETDVAVSDAPPQVTESIELEEQAGNALQEANPESAPVKAEETPKAPAKDEAPVAPSPKIPSSTDNKWSRETLFDKRQNSGDAKAATDDDKSTEPAMHHATSALYIRNLERPVKIADLERDLISYASPPSAERDASIIKTIFLDAVKTHALVLFTSVSAASRARSSLHGRKWPAEEKWRRKELWVDFIPDDKVAEWIEDEKSNNDGKTGGRRWEVVYVENEEGVVEAMHREEGSNTSLAPRQPSGQGMSNKDSTGPPPNAPLGPRSSMRQDRPSVSSRPTGPTPGTIPNSQAKNFGALDDLFEFTTTAKPKLYWKPVSDELVTRRKDEFKNETSRDWTPAKWTDRDEEKRYTFEDQDRLVHSGPHNTSSRVRRREEDIRRGILPGSSTVSVGGGRGGGRHGGRDWEGYRGRR